MRREIAGQAVGVDVGRQVVKNFLPQRLVAQTDGLAGLLLQTDERVIGEPIAHARQAFGQRGLQRDLEATTRDFAGRIVQAVRRRGKVDLLSVDLRQQGLLHGDGRSRDDALADLQRVACPAAGRILGADFPKNFLRAGEGELHRGGHVPGDFLCAVCGKGDRLRLEFEQRGARRNVYLHLFLGGVTQGDLCAELVAFAHQRRQAADNLQVLRRADARFAGAKAIQAAVGNGDDLETGQRIVERYAQFGLPVGVELDPGIPQQQGVEQFARQARATATTSGHGLAAVVTATDDFHLRRGCIYAPGTLLVHGMQQVPAPVGKQFEQCLIDGGDSDFRIGGWLAIRQVNVDRHLCLLAYLITFLIGLDVDFQGAVCEADFNFRHAEAIGWFAQIDQRCWRGVFLAVVAESLPPFAGRLEAPGKEAVPGDFVQASAQRQYADVDVRPPFRTDLQFHRRILASQRDDFTVQDAFAFDRQQCPGAAEGHTHLEFGSLARLIGPFFRQDVHAVVIVATPPDFALARDGDARAGFGSLAFVVAGRGDQLDFAGLGDFDVAEQQPTAVAGAAAHTAQVFDALLVVVRIEAADQAFAAGHGFMRDGAYVELGVCFWRAVGIERQRLKFQILVDRHPAFRLDAGDDCRRPDALPALQALDFAVGIAVAGFEGDVQRCVAGRDVFNGQFTAAVLVELECQMVGEQARTARIIRIFIRFLVRLITPAPRLAERKFIVTSEVDPARRAARRHVYRQAVGCTAVDVGQLHAYGQLVQRRERWLVDGDDTAGHRRQAEFFDAEAAAFQPDLVIVLVFAVQRDRVFAELGVLRDLPFTNGALTAAGIGLPLQRQFDLLAAARMHDAQDIQRRGCRRETLQIFGTQVVLHGDRFAGAEQAAVKHAVRAQVKAAPFAGRRVETPGFDAAIPVAPDEGHVLHAFGVGGAGTDEERIAVAGFFTVAFGGVDGGWRLPDALFVGLAVDQRLAITATDGDLRVGDRLAVVQPRHPDQRIFPSALEMYAQVRYQGAGAHVHRMFAVARVKQTFAEQRGGDFQYVEARLHGNADDFEWPWGCRSGFPVYGNGLRLHAGNFAQQRNGAGFDVVVVDARQLFFRRAFGRFGDRRRQVAGIVFGGLLAGDDALILVTLDFSIPADDVRVGGQGQRAQIGFQFCVAGCLDGITRFDVAQADRQQSRAVFAFGKAFNDAKVG